MDLFCGWVVRPVLNQWQGARAQLGGLSEGDRADRDLCKQGTRTTRRLGAVGKQVQFLSDEIRRDDRCHAGHDGNY